MPRELNPNVFSETLVEPTNSEVPAAIKPSSSQSLADFDAQDAINQKLMEEIQFLKRRLREAESNTKKLESQMRSQVEASFKANKQLLSGQRSIESVMKTNLSDLTGKLSRLAAKVTDFRIGESKTRELVERHNQIVYKYEARLQQVQKLISSQEMKLMNYEATLKKWQQSSNR